MAAARAARERVALFVFRGRPRHDQFLFTHRENHSARTSESPAIKPFRAYVLRVVIPQRDAIAPTRIAPHLVSSSSPATRLHYFGYDTLRTN